MAPDPAGAESGARSGAGAGGFEGLVAAPNSAGRPTGSPPDGIRTVARIPAGGSATRLVLVRHGEAECNVSGVCGGIKGCTGLTAKGVAQVTALADRLERTGELAGADALYASVLPRAIETAELLAPALRPIGSERDDGAEGDDGSDGADGADGADRGEGGEGAVGSIPAVTTECGLCELHPGDADGLTWEEFSARYSGPDWDDHPDHPIAPGGESWTEFVLRVAAALEAVVARHPGSLVVVACHAGVIEASLLSMLPLVDGRAGARLQLRTQHASLTTWEVEQGRWRLLGYNDASHLIPPRLPGPVTSPEPMVAHRA